jgi:hypothetical protein
VRQQLAALAHQVESPSQQVPRGAHAGRVDVGLGQHAASQQHGDLVGVDPVVLGLAPVDGLHEQRVAEHEADPFLRTQVRQPVPGVDALAGHHEVVAIGRHGLEQRLGLRRKVLVHEHLARGVEDAHVHRAHVQIDPAVEAVLAGVESHRSSSCAPSRAPC